MRPISTPNFDNLVSHYERCFSRHGDTAEGFDWPTEAHRQKTFQMMSELPDWSIPAGAAPTFLDVGCGTGAFYSYLRSHAPSFAYSGIDLSAIFIDEAKKKFPGVPFSVVDVMDEGARLETFDYIVCNGVFTQKLNLTDAEMLDLFRKMMVRLWSKTRLGLAFNVMSEDLVDWKKENLFYLSFSELSRFLKKELSTKFIFRRDYGFYEFTTYVLR